MLTRFFSISLPLAMLLWSRTSVCAQQNPAGLALPDTAKVTDVFTPAPSGDVHFRNGFLGERFDANAKVRMLTVDENDMLDAFERRTAPHQDWQGEHVGKFLHAATLTWVNTGDAKLKEKIDRVAARLLKTQEEDGYLGTYVPAHRWTSWDVWVHKYDLLGLLTYYQYTHELAASETDHALSDHALLACRRIGDLMIQTFGTGPGQRDINKSGEHVGMAPDSILEPIVLLYRATNDPRYLGFAQYIVANYDAPGGPAILASLEKYQSVRKVANAKAYEMTSNLNGLLELYRASGDKRLLDDMKVAWDDIVANRLYVTGSASSFEHFQDEDSQPNGNKSNICETCVTVTWEQMCLQMLRLTGEPKYAEQIERTAYNHLLGAQKPTGDDWSYYTPLEGRKPYDKVTTCCHSSGPRGVALLPSVAYMTGADGGLIINLYNAGDATTTLPSGKVTITQETDYPLSGKVEMKIAPEKRGAHFPLRLRIPSWAAGTDLLLNGRRVKQAPEPGAYAVLDRNWKKGDRVTLNFLMTPRMAFGEHDNEGAAALLYGPLVLAVDSALNPTLNHLKQVELSTDDVKSLKLIAAPDRARTGELVFATKGKLAQMDGVFPLYLTPYANAGQDSLSHFEVWIARPGHGIAPAAGSLFDGARASYSREGNQKGNIADTEATTVRDTFNSRKAGEDWFAVTRDTPTEINRIVFIHGKAFHDGGWFDTAAGKPRVQVQEQKDGDWKTIATLDSYPDTTAVAAAGLKDGQTFTVKFPTVRAVAIRVLGAPSSGDSPQQNFSSCAGLQAFLDR